MLIIDLCLNKPRLGSDTGRLAETSSGTSSQESWTHYRAFSTSVRGALISSKQASCLGPTKHPTYLGPTNSMYATYLGPHQQVYVLHILGSYTKRTCYNVAHLIYQKLFEQKVDIKPIPWSHVSLPPFNSTHHLEKKTSEEKKTRWEASN